MGHLWQRFLLACALLVGLAVGVGATVFGYSNLGTVDVHWSVFHLDGVPLWAVALVPVTLILVAGTVYHWLDGLHHFTEHMRHRHRVRELEAEVTRLREHLDHVLEMPRGDKSAPLPAAEVLEAPETPSLPAAGTEPDTEPRPEAEATTTSDTAKPDEGSRKPPSDRRKRSRIIMEAEPAAAAVTNGAESETAVATAAASKEG